MPLLVYGARGDAEHLTYLFAREAAIEAQPDELGLARVELLEPR